MSEMSFAASEILEGLHEALQDAKGVPVEGGKDGCLSSKTERSS